MKKYNVNLKVARGLRNNNPLNIIRSRAFQWKGQRTEQTDRRFVQFENMPMGYRAAFRVLQNYHDIHDCITLRQYIQRWAPPQENDTRSYLQTVAKYANVKPDERLVSPKVSKHLWMLIVAGMHTVECGTQPIMGQIERGWELAFKGKGLKG